MEIDAANIDSFFHLPDELQEAQISKLLSFLNSYFKDIFPDESLSRKETNEEQALKIKVFNELAVNILRDLHFNLKLNNKQIKLAIGLIFKNIVDGLKEDLSVDQIHSNFKNDLLKYIADQIWVNKKVFDKDEVMGIYNIFYDNFLDYAYIYGSIIGKRQVLHLETFNATNLSSNTNILELNNFELIDIDTLDFLKDNIDDTSKNDTFMNNDKENFDVDFSFTIMSKEEMRNLKTLKEKELKINMLLEKEKAKIDSLYEEQIKNLR